MNRLFFVPILFRDGESFRAGQVRETESGPTEKALPGFRLIKLWVSGKKEKFINTTAPKKSIRSSFLFVNCSLSGLTRFHVLKVAVGGPFT